MNIEITNNNQTITLKGNVVIALDDNDSTLNVYTPNGTIKTINYDNSNLEIKNGELLFIYNNDSFIKINNQTNYQQQKKETITINNTKDLYAEANYLIKSFFDFTGITKNARINQEYQEKYLIDKETLEILKSELDTLKQSLTPLPHLIFQEKNTINRTVLISEAMAKLHNGEKMEYEELALLATSTNEEQLLGLDLYTERKLASSDATSVKTFIDNKSKIKALKILSDKSFKQR